MARSNNQDRTGPPTAPLGGGPSNGGPTGGRPARPQQAVDHGLPWAAQSAPNGGPAAGYPPEPQFGAQHLSAYAAHPGYDAPPAGQLPWPQPGASPQSPAAPSDPYARHGYPQQHGYQPEPQFGQYLPQAEPQSGYGAPAGYQDPAPQLRGSYAQSEPGFAPQAARGYPQAPGYPAQPGGHDPQGYDLGAYATQPPPYSPQGGGRTQTAPPQPGAYADYGAAYGQPAQHGQPPQAQPPMSQGYAQAQGQPPAADGDYDDDYEDDEDEADAPRRFGVVKIVASLAIAVVLGGGAAYGYKMFGGRLTSGQPPVVLKADASPSKTRPASQQSASLTNSSSSSDDALPAVVPSGDNNSDSSTPAGARRVQTIPIAPNSGSSPVAPGAPPMRPSMSMPGLVVEGMPQPGSAPQRTVTSPPVMPAPAARTLPVAPNKVMAAAEAPAAVAVAPAPKAPAKPLVQVPKVAKTADAFVPGGAPSAVGAASVATATTTPAAPAAVKTAANGYVAVLFSSPPDNAVAARKNLDALQAKYPDVLGGKATDVTPANVNGKDYLRGVVGPPGSLASAKAVCTQLKAAGHTECFAAAY